MGTVLDYLGATIWTCFTNNLWDGRLLVGGGRETYRLNRL